jgi:hypothetical protein
MLKIQSLEKPTKKAPYIYYSNFINYFLLSNWILKNKIIIQHPSVEFDKILQHIGELIFNFGHQRFFFNFLMLHHWLASQKGFSIKWGQVFRTCLHN